MESGYEVREIHGIRTDSMLYHDLTDFLEENHLVIDGSIDHTVTIVDGDGRLIASGSSSGNVIKYLAVSASHRSEGLLAPILTALIREITNNGGDKIFIYTAPGNEDLFREFGFFPVARTDEILLLENRKDGIGRWLKRVGAETEQRFGKGDGPRRVGVIVMNCDPFTRGHRYLIEYAAARSDILHIFILSSGGTFTPQERYAMVEAGTADLGNVMLHKASDYMVSPATFPTYFIKAEKPMSEVSCALDIQIFTRVIAPALGITLRFVGTEPYCPVTSVYNRMMQEALPGQGIEFIEIPRFEFDGRAVSASEVRRHYHAGDWESLEPLVPLTTYEILRGLPGR